MRSLATRLILAALLCALAPTLADAHSGDVITQEILPFDGGQQWVVRGNFGLALSDDPTGYVCEEAFLSTGVFRIGALGPRDWLIWTQDQHIWRTDDACSFEQVATLDLYPQAVAAHAPSGRALWVEGEGSQTVVWTADRGDTTVRVQLPTPAGVQWTGARFGTADRVALSGYRTDDEAAGEGVLGWIDLSDNAWTPITGVEGARWPYLLVAADGQAAGLANKDEQLIAFWSTPETTRTIPLDGWPTGMVFDDEGGITATGAGITGGLWRWTPDADRMVPLYEDHSGACLARVGDAWWMCSRSLRDGDDASQVPLDDPTATPTLAIDLTRLTGPRSACAPTSDVGRVCPAVWPELGRTLGVLPPVDLPDMGVTHDLGTAEDMGSADLGSSTPPPPPGTSDSSCATTGPSAPAAPLALGLWLFGVGVMVRRRPQSPPLRAPLAPGDLG